MSGSLVTTLILPLLLLLISVVTISAAVLDDEEDRFFEDCPSSRCGSGPEVRFPLRLNSYPPYCGASGLPALSCSSSNETVLTNPSFGKYIVSAIDYQLARLTIHRASQPQGCFMRNLNYTVYEDPADVLYISVEDVSDVSLIRCSYNFTPTHSLSIVPTHSRVAGPIPCLAGGDNGFFYVVDSSRYVYLFPQDCRVVSTGWQIPQTDLPFGETVDAFVGGREYTFNIKFFSPQCQQCEEEGNRCGFSRARNDNFCHNPAHHDHGSHTKLITGSLVGGVLMLVSVALILLYRFRKSDKDKETRLKIKRFLAMYKTTTPTRYTFADIKKITKRFKQKLGQGGFGSVYKGGLPNGIPVAVKMLEKSTREGEEFMTEVATMGRIHHVNVVRLLGFCSEGNRHALVYELMSNESLEKFIFSKEAAKNYRPLDMKKLPEIALGIARGVEYLHQGCDHRILHFDIKPHNSLLDHDLNPKISDFGLAKLCSRDDSIVTMTAARGTMGYIAPEIYSRNFGTVSYKSDVYSFGMLVLEMVGGRRNTSPATENQDEIYFPEWAYDRLVNGQDLGIATRDVVGKEEIAKKLAIVALWCIQWSPMDRPSMTKVVQMLVGNLQSLEMPPKPFVSSSDGGNQ